MAGLRGALHAISTQYKLLALGFPVQLVGDPRHRVLRVDIPDAVHVRLLDDGRRPCISTARDGVFVEDREQTIRITAWIDVVNGVAAGITRQARLNRGHWSVS